MSLLPKAIYRFNAILIKFPRTFFMKIEPKKSKIYIEPQNTANSQHTPENREQSWRYHTPDFKLNYKAIVIRTAWNERKRYTDQRKRK